MKSPIKKVSIVPDPQGNNPKQTNAISEALQTNNKKNLDTHTEYDLTHRSFRHSVQMDDVSGLKMRQNAYSFTIVCLYILIDVKYITFG